MVAQIIAEDFPKLLVFTTELEPVVAASKMELDHAKEIVGKYRSLVAQLRQASDAMAMLMTDDGLPSRADKYLDMAEPLCLQFDERMRDAMQGYEEVRAAYGEDSMKPEEFFGTFASFVGDFQTALTENQQTAKA
jgi:hypothetical protein